jgi:hypothetical protein
MAARKSIMWWQKMPNNVQNATLIAYYGRKNVALQNQGIF